MEPLSTDKFLELVRKSKLIDPAQLDAWLRRGDRGARESCPSAQLARMLVKDGLLTSYQADLLLAGRWQNFVLNGKYKVLSLLGTGGMGSVYLCEHLRMSRRVAVKVLPPSLADDPLALQRFLREARALGALDHPNIVHAHDFECEGRMPFIVMEHVEGTNLQKLVAEQGPLGVAQATHCLAQAAAGLEHARKAGWVHRDIKPANLLVDRAGTVKLLDMGLAKLFQDGGSSVTQDLGDQSIMGTADYIAPEQALNGQDVDIRADIYSLGATFYFALTGQALFPGVSAAQKLLFHQVKAPTPIRQLRPEVPQALAAVIERALSKRREARYQTPAELVAALDPVLRQLPLGPSLPGKRIDQAISSRALPLGLAQRMRSAGAGAATEPLEGRRCSLARASWLRWALAGSVVLLGTAIVLLAARGRPTSRPSDQQALPDAPPTKSTLTDQAFKKWLATTADLPLEKQKAAVVQKLKEMNPSFDGPVKFDANEHHVTRVELRVDNVKDLAPLRALTNLSGLVCTTTGQGKGQATDLEPLQGLKLTQLDCRHCQVRDLNPLRGMPLQQLYCDNTPVADLAPLQGMKLTSLWVSNTQVRDLTALREMPLTQLHCENTAVADLGPLQGMKLTELQCNQTQVRDLVPLQGMKLTKLDCRKSQVRDLTPLQGMPLQQLLCDNTAVADLGPLLGMKLTILWFANTQVRDLSALRGMPLTQLHCDNTPVADLGPLQGMKLTELQCNQTQVRDLAPLQGMKLTKLDCRKSQVRDLTSLQGMPLQQLLCDNTAVADLGPLQGMKLTVLWCGNSKVRDLSALRGMPLTQLHCDNTPVADLGPLQGMKLTELQCNHTQVRDLTPLRGMPLQQFHCQRTPVADLAPLQGMKLTILDCRNSQVVDLTPLKGMPLSQLYCSNTAVADLGPLEGMKLTYLDCDQTKVRDLAPLQGMKLTELRCNGTQVRDLTPLQGMPLRQLRCASTPVTDLGPLRGMNLIVLECRACQVRDLAPLKGMLLQQLYCSGTPVATLGPLQGMKLVVLDCRQAQIRDLTPLRDMPLETLWCDFEAARDAEILRVIKTLKNINDQPAADFWRKVASAKP